MELILRKKCEACATELCNVRTLVRDACAILGYQEEDTNHLTIAIDEAVANIIKHAYKDCADAGMIVEIFRSGDEAIFLLQDFAASRDASWIKIREEDLLTPGGLGLNLIFCIMDNVKLLPSPYEYGNLLELRKKLPRD